VRPQALLVVAAACVVGCGNSETSGSSAGSPDQPSPRASFITRSDEICAREERRIDEEIHRAARFGDPPAERVRHVRRAVTLIDDLSDGLAADAPAADEKAIRAVTSAYGRMISDLNMLAHGIETGRRLTIAGRRAQDTALRDLDGARADVRRIAREFGFSICGFAG
jgi:hypothetical protein